ncbi:MAG TPA: hypothetical protein VHS58_04160 [Acetobacteraceae bacterium]|nr:hypothetical protein [Acetobacteraceae bacterium]
MTDTITDTVTHAPDPSDHSVRAASPGLPLALVAFGESIAADTVKAVRKRDWRTLLVLAVVGIFLCRLATLVLRIRAGRLPAACRRASPAAQTPPYPRWTPCASSRTPARTFRAVAHAAPAIGEAASLGPRPAAATGRAARHSPHGRPSADILPFTRACARLSATPARASPTPARPRQFFETLAASRLSVRYSLRYRNHAAISRAKKQDTATGKSARGGEVHALADERPRRSRRAARDSRANAPSHSSGPPRSPSRNRRRLPRGGSRSTS